MGFLCAFCAIVGIIYGTFRLYQSGFDLIAKIFGYVLLVGLTGVVLTTPFPNGATVICGLVGLGVIAQGAVRRWNATWWQITLSIGLPLAVGVYLVWPIFSGGYSIPEFPPVKPTPVVSAPVPTYAPEPPAISSRVTKPKKVEREEEEDEDDPCPPDSGYSYGYRKAAGCFDQ